MKTLSELVIIGAPAERVFAFMDDVNNVGFHMSGRSSMAMMGSRLKIDVLSPQPIGIDATYRMWGKTAMAVAPAQAENRATMTTAA